MQRRRADKPTDEEMRLMAENNRLGARILELEKEVLRLGTLASDNFAVYKDVKAHAEAVERENRSKCLELAEAAGARDGAARELLFLAGVEGISGLSRGGKECVRLALQYLRPDIAEQSEDPFALLQRFFPEEG